MSTKSDTLTLSVRTGQCLKKRLSFLDHSQHWPDIASIFCIGVKTATKTAAAVLSTIAVSTQKKWPSSPEAVSPGPPSLASGFWPSAQEFLYSIEARGSDSLSTSLRAGLIAWSKPFLLQMKTLRKTEKRGTCPRLRNNCQLLQLFSNSAFLLFQIFPHLTALVRTGAHLPQQKLKMPGNGISLPGCRHFILFLASQMLLSYVMLGKQ